MGAICMYLPRRAANALVQAVRLRVKVEGAEPLRALRALDQPRGYDGPPRVEREAASILVIQRVVPRPVATTQRYFNTSTEAIGAALRKAMGW